MCGIAGIAGNIEPAVTESTVERMTCALAARGPDGQGIESWNDAVLGHRRLAIFDLSDAGRQPMLSADRSIGVVFNGAIYNHRELRSELKARGYSFASQTDTEVLVHGYHAWGLNVLVSKLRGMFAFGLWDDCRKKLFLVRDRLGVKPLIFCLRHGSIAFASTIRALRTAGYVKEIDENAVKEFLSLGYLTDDLSIYRGAVKVGAGSIIEWANGAVKVREYWQPPRVKSSQTYPFKEVVDETERLLLDSVRVRLHADVPVGALLSGGIDSALICWAIMRLGGNVKAYTVSIPGDPWDESVAAGETARRLGIQHCVLQMSDRDKPQIEELVSAYGEPFACASALGMLTVSRAVASSAKVLLTGDGGDDVFLGYPPHRYFWVAGRLARMLPSFAKKLWLTYRSAFPRTGSLRRVASLFDRITIGLGPTIGNPASWAIYKSEGLLGERLVSSSHVRTKVSCSIDGGYRVLADYLEYMQKAQFVGQYLTKVDGATMRYGVEARSPFLDQFIWEFASSLPFEMRLRGGRLKAILREIVKRRIGTDIANRRKTGFGVPVQRWMVGRWCPQVKMVLQESILGKEGWIRSNPVLAYLELATRNGWAPEQLWYIYVLESWLRYDRLTHCSGKTHIA